MLAFTPTATSLPKETRKMKKKTRKTREIKFKNVISYKQGNANSKGKSH